MKGINFSTQNARNVHKAAEATISPFDTTMDALECETPYPDNNGIFRKPPFDAEVLYARRANGKNAELSRIETKFNLTIVAILSRERVNSHLRTVCLCSDSSELTCNLSTEAARILESSTDPTWKVRHSRVRFGERVRNFGYLEQAIEFAEKLDPELKPVIVDSDTGEIINEEVEAHGETEKVSPVRSISKWNQCVVEKKDWLDEMVAQHHPDAADQVGEGAEGVCGTSAYRTAADVHCAICARKLTNPESRRVQVGPICREKVGMRGGSHLRGDIVSKKLIEASKLYNDPKSQKWILQGCLQLDAPVPVKVVKQRDTEYWGLKRNSVLYYLSKDNKVHSLYKVGKELKYKRITASCRDSELDQLAFREAKEYIASGGKKLRTILL